MTSRCAICRRDDRAAIDSMLVAGTSEREVAAAFRLPKSTIHVHKARCIASVITEAIQREREQVGDRLLNQLDFLLGRALDVIARSEAKRNDALVLKGIAAACDVVKLRADLTGVKPEPPQRISYSVTFVGGRPVTTADAPALPAGEEHHG